MLEKPSEFNAMLLEFSNRVSEDRLLEEGQRSEG